jgi:thiol-disulfide isomerase/thioredoxin
MNSPSPESAPLPHAAALQSRLLVAALVVFSIAVVAWPHRSSVAPQGGFLLDGDGRAATLGPRLAPVTLLHFWATWCPPCTAEAPSLARLTRDFGGRHDFGIVMIAVADSRERVGSFMGGGASGVLFDPQWDVAHRYGTEKLPETYLLVHGKVAHKWVGQTDWDDREVRATIEREIGSSVAPRSSSRNDGSEQRSSS